MAVGFKSRFKTWSIETDIYGSYKKSNLFDDFLSNLTSSPELVSEPFVSEDLDEPPQESSVGRKRG